MSNNIVDSEFALSNIAWFWGILAESTSTKGQRELQVYVPDITPIRNGDVTNKGSTTTISLFNVMTQSWEEREPHLSKTIVAEYLGYESSREVPDMYKGQQVLVMTYGCHDRWFWIPIERDDYIKPFEHVKLRCADLALIHKLKTPMTEDDARKAYLHDDNTYFVEIDTKYNKHIFFSTAGTDGEKYRYFMKFDANAHTVEIWDGLVDSTDTFYGKCLDRPRNTIKIESDPVYTPNGSGIDRFTPGQTLNGRITLQNAAGTTIILEDEDLNIVVPRDLNIHVGRDVTTNIERDHARSVSGDEKVKIGGNLIEAVMNTVQKYVKGLFTYLFASGREEQVTASYNCVVGANMTQTIGTNHTVTTGNQYSYTATNIKILANTNAQYLGGYTVVGNGNSLSFVAKTINTSSYIYGCCRC